MSLIYNGKEIPSDGEIIYNDTSLNKVLYNGELVWQKVIPPSPSNVYIATVTVGTSASNVPFTQFKNANGEAIPETFYEFIKDECILMYPRSWAGGTATTSGWGGQDHSARTPVPNPVGQCTISGNNIVVPARANSGFNWTSSWIQYTSDGPKQGKDGGTTSSVGCTIHIYLPLIPAPFTTELGITSTGNDKLNVPYHTGFIVSNSAGRAADSTHDDAGATETETYHYSAGFSRSATQWTYTATTSGWIRGTGTGTKSGTEFCFYNVFMA